MSNERKIIMRAVDIHKWFGSLYAVRGVSLDIYEGEVIGIVGDNGAGKSTLMKILAGYYKPDKGEIYVDNKKVEFNSPHEARELGIEMMYQDLSLVSTMNVVRNFFLGKEITGKLGFLNMNKMKEETKKALENIGLNIPKLELRVDELSGGQRQGLAFSRSYYFKKRVLILDEPTNNLSVKETNRVMNFIQSLKSLKISILFVSHNLFHVHEAADRIVVIAKGKKIGEFLKSEISVNELASLITTGS
ncbi:ATP-binding cassette domain-containing protein [Sulfolobus sp. E11-6]|uniref:ATP-binding cassette domain-containing protein n=1 Tax=Sulfolobus sp. E11-6 TaxID=2663020 RepID=UPI00129601F6|nr:ATP-binding cassette domain-containing protein [Sulfolobus sp. E11-6]QGA68104.1 ATP-binding cassette domain-containing protein [Sulfolobus sp. E11-6]